MKENILDNNYSYLPDISIIVPARNEEDCINQVVMSLLAQSTPPHEIIIADGGSSDSTKDIVRKIIAKGHSIRLIEDENAFPGRARNLAIAAAETEWIAMTDAGTIVPPDWLANLASHVENDRDVEIIFGTYEPILSSRFKECLALAFIPPGIEVDGGFWRGPSTASMLLKKSVWEKVGEFPEDLRACEDLIFFDRLKAGQFLFRTAPNAIVHWNMPDDLAGIYYRFKTYSLHTLIAGRWRSWHLALGRMYAIGLSLIALSVFHHWIWSLALFLGLLGRIHHSIKMRQPSLILSHKVDLMTYLSVLILCLWIDLAAFAGFLDFIISGRSLDDVDLKS